VIQVKVLLPTVGLLASLMPTPKLLNYSS